MFFRIIFCLIVVLSIFTNWGFAKPPMNPIKYTLTTTPVEIKMGTKPSYGFCVGVYDSEWYYMTSQTDADPKLMDFNICYPHQVDANETLFWAKSNGGTIYLYIIPFRKKNF